MTSLRSSVRPKSSKQPWGTILVPEFGLGYQKMTSYETDQTVKRLYHIRHTRDQFIERPHTATLDKAGEKEMVDRLCKDTRCRAPDVDRTQRNSVYQQMGIVNSFAWRGFN